MTQAAKDEAVFFMLKELKTTGPIADAIRGNITPRNATHFISELVSQGKDNPDTMAQILGFNIFKYLGMKVFTTDEINAQLQQAGFAYRVLGQTPWTDVKAEWVGIVGYNLKPYCMTLVDSRFNRYLKFANGQIFVCTSEDLKGLSHRDETVLKARLTGQID